MENTIRIYVANLGKYNDGILQGEWFTLPHDIEDIYVQIGVGQYDEDGNYTHGVVERDAQGNEYFYEEWAIHDYEAPFRIEEYDSIERLNELAETLERLNIGDSVFTDSPDVYDVLNFASELCNENIVSDADEYTQNIITDEGLDEMVENISRESGWQRVKYFLSGIEYMNDDFYVIDGYGNAQNATSDYLKNIVDDLFTEVVNNIG